MPPKPPPPREAVVLPIVLAVAVVTTVAFALMTTLGHNGPGDTGWLTWMLLAFGLVGIGSAVFDKQQKPGPGSGWRTQGLVLFLGPTGARIAWALMGGGFLGGAIGLLIG